MSKVSHYIARVALLLACAWATPASAIEQTHRGIRLFAFDAVAPPRGVALTRPEIALERLARAYDMLIDHSPASARAIRRLRDRGTVMLIYYPGALRSRRSLNAEPVALYLPDFLKKRGKSLGAGPEYIVVVNHMGILWNSRELAGLIAHELVGHGGQQARGQLAGARPIDLECEASLHEEQAYQDLRMAKSRNVMVAFRIRLETHHCADFRAYMMRFRPKSMRLWAPRNPDVAALLREFERYRRVQRDHRRAQQLTRRTR